MKLYMNWTSDDLFSTIRHVYMSIYKKNETFTDIEL